MSLEEASKFSADFKQTFYPAPKTIADVKKRFGDKIVLSELSRKKCIRI